MPDPPLGPIIVVVYIGSSVGIKSNAVIGGIKKMHLRAGDFYD
jgi:hypothetical protein